MAKNFAVMGAQSLVYPVDLRSHDKAKIRVARSSVPSSYFKRCATWEEACKEATEYNRLLVEEAQEMLDLIEAAEGPEDRDLADFIEDRGIL